MKSWLQFVVAICLAVGVWPYAEPRTVLSSQKLPVTIPIQVAANLVYMHGHVNDSRQLSVALDTGSSVSIVAPDVAQQIGLHPSGSAKAAGIGHGSSERVQFVEGARLQWGAGLSALRIVGQRVAILPIGYVAEEVGHPTDAIFGSNVFENFRVTVDYQHERATFASPSSPVGDAGASIPIKIMGGTPFVTAMLVSPNGSRISGLFLLDSGTTGPLVLNKLFLSAHPQITRGQKFADTPPVNAVGGKIVAKLVRIAELDLGPFHFNQPIATVPENSRGALAHPEIAGFIGAGILCRFTVTWDYAHGRIFLKPNSRLSDVFDADASGLRLTVTPPDYGTIHVVAVLPGSPAALAGLRVGDVIASFNGKKDLKLWRVTEELKKTGTTPVLSILRGKKEITITLHLRSLV